MEKHVIIMALICIIIGIWFIPWVTMSCWNGVMPYLFGLKTINWTQAVMLNILSGLFFYRFSVKKN